MSTNARLKELEAAGELRLWQSDLMPPRRQTRRFFVTPELAVCLDAEPWQPFLGETEDEVMMRRVETHSKINSFVQGDTLVVGSGNSGSCDLKCLRPNKVVRYWKVFTLRASDKRPLTRVIGFFAEPDTFVATHMFHRALADRVGWDKVMQAALDRWTTLFATEEPIGGAKAAPPIHQLGQGYDDARA
jgi:hypothetical protein